MAGNIALNKAASASNSIFPYIPAKAVDGTVGPLARWVGSSPLPRSPVWLQISLDGFYWINRWVVRQMGELGWSINYNLSDYRLQGSLDGANWFDMDAVAGNSANQTDRPINPTKTKWVRIYITSGLRCNTNFASIAELELYAADPTDSKLSSLVLSNSIALYPQFVPTLNVYNANAKYDDSSITITPTAADPRATIKVNGSPAASGHPSAPIDLTAGVNNPVSVEVAPFIGEVNTYTVNAVRATSPYLSGLSIVGMRGGGLAPVFDSRTLNYTSNVPNSKDSINIIPIAEDSTASITVNGINIVSGQQSQQISLQVGSNTVIIKVKSNKGDDYKEYTITVTRQA